MKSTLRNSLQQFFLIPAFIVFLVAAAFFQSGFLAQEVSVNISSPQTEALIWTTTADNQLRRFALDSTGEKKLIKDIVIQVPFSSVRNIKNVSVSIGVKKFDFDNEAFLAQWSKKFIRSSSEVVIFFVSPSTVHSGSSLWPPARKFINWGGLGRVTERKYLSVIGPTVVLALAVYFIFLSQLTLIRRRVKEFLSAQQKIFLPPSSKPKGRYTGPVLIGLAFLIGCFFYLERMDPYYFTQDDSLTQFLPVMEQAAEGFLKTGMFPTINPYQVMGSPNTTLGTYALTYPLTYLSYAIAAMILNNPYAMLEVFAFLHLVLGYLALVWFFRLRGLEPMWAVLASLSFVLCGYNLIVGRSWYYMLPAALWMPLLMVAVEKFRSSKLSSRWVLATGAVLGLFFHAGNAQIWIYALMFLTIALGIIIFQSEKRMLKLFHAVMALGLGITIALPLLATMFLAVKDVPRIGGQGEGIAAGLWAMLFPYPLSQATHGIFFNEVYRPLEGQLYYSGTLFTIAGLFAVAVYLIQLSFFYQDKAARKEWLTVHIWLLPFVLAFLFSLGREGVLWPLAAKFPLFNKFNHPFKFLPFVHLFLISMGAVVLNAYWNKLKLPKKINIAVYACVFALLFYHVGLCKKALRVFAANPYPALPTEIDSVVQSARGEKPQRIWAIHEPSLDKVGDPRLPLTMVRDFATVYRLPAVNGYEPLVNAIDIDLEKFIQYGVRYVILEPRIDILSVAPFLAPMKKDIRFVTTNDVVIYRLPAAMPMAFVDGRPKEDFPLQWTPQGARVDTSSLSQPADVVVNLFFRKGYEAFAQGRKLRIMPDKYNRIVVADCPATVSLEVKYMSAWPFGAAGVIVLAFVVTAGILNLREKSKLFES